MTSMTLTLDSRKRITLGKILPDPRTSSVKAYIKDDKIILEPLVEIPARELWLYQNKKALHRVKQGLSQKGSVSRGSFSKFAKD